MMFMCSINWLEVGPGRTTLNLYSQPCRCNFTHTILFALLTLLACPLWAAGERLPVWQVRSEHAQVILLGSIHMAFPEIYPLREDLETAFAAADVLAVEVDISGENAQAIQQLLKQRGLLPEGETLQQQLSTQSWEALQQYLRSRALPLEAFERMRPGLVVTLLSSMRMTEMGMRADQGIDLHFLDLARGEKTVVELETAEQQMELLLEFPQPDLLLAQTLVQLDQIDLYMGPIYDAWRAGDAQQLSRLLLEDERQRHPEFSTVFEALFDRRNRAMALQIQDFLQGSGHYFVVVGAGHLVGSEGIVALLERQGYAVYQWK